MRIEYSFIFICALLAVWPMKGDFLPNVNNRFNIDQMLSDRNTFRIRCRAGRRASGARIRKNMGKSSVRSCILDSLIASPFRAIRLNLSKPKNSFADPTLSKAQPHTQTSRAADRRAAAAALARLLKPFSCVFSSSALGMRSRDHFTCPKSRPAAQRSRSRATKNWRRETRTTRRHRPTASKSPSSPSTSGKRRNALAAKHRLLTSLFFAWRPRQDGRRQREHRLRNARDEKLVNHRH